MDVRVSPPSWRDRVRRVAFAAAPFGAALLVAGLVARATGNLRWLEGVAQLIAGLLAIAGLRVLGAPVSLLDELPWLSIEQKPLLVARRTSRIDDRDAGELLGATRRQVAAAELTCVNGALRVNVSMSVLIARGRLGRVLLGAQRRGSTTLGTVDGGAAWDALPAIIDAAFGGRRPVGMEREALDWLAAQMPGVDRSALIATARRRFEACGGFLERLTAARRTERTGHWIAGVDGTVALSELPEAVWCALAMIAEARTE